MTTDYGNQVSVTIPKRALGLVLERAEIELEELRDQGEVLGEEENAYDDIAGAIDEVTEALDNATTPVTIDSIDELKLPGIPFIVNGLRFLTAGWMDSNELPVIRFDDAIRDTLEIPPLKDDIEAEKVFRLETMPTPSVAPTDNAFVVEGYARMSYMNAEFTEEAAREDVRELINNGSIDIETRILR